MAAHRATAQVIEGELTVVCPACNHKNLFPGWSEISIFICDECGEPIVVEQTDFPIN